jgi:hypothetical protein
MSDRSMSTVPPAPDVARARATTSGAPRVPAPRTAPGLDRLQRAAGNQVVHRLLRTAGIQAKLTVNPPDDEYEREADQVADEVMRMPATAPAIQRRIGVVQRKCAACEAAEHDAGESGPVQRKCAACAAEEDEEPHGHVQAKQHGASPGPDAAPADVERYVHGSRGGGASLPAVEREYFESRLGYDLGGVRVHTGSDAGHAAAAIDARAFTSGSDVFFARGEYAPGSSSGRQLLAHELTHVVQQSAAPVRPGQEPDEH